MKNIMPARRLIVAADYKPTVSGRRGVYGNVRDLSLGLSDMGCVIKVNSILRAQGYDLIDQVHDMGLGLFADEKLIDIGETLATDGALLREARPEFLTAMCSAGVEGLKRLKGELPDTKVLGVTILTTLLEADTQRIFGCSVKEGVLRFAHIGMEAGLDGFICAPAEARLLRIVFGEDIWIASPGVRFADKAVASDDQNVARVMTPKKAIEAGVDCVVMGRPIIEADDPEDAAMRAIAEITLGLAA